MIDIQGVIKAVNDTKAILLDYKKQSVVCNDYISGGVEALDHVMMQVLDCGYMSNLEMRKDKRQ